MRTLYNINSLFIVFAGALFLTSLSTLAPLSAKVLPHYDLDSLIHMSDCIVAAEILEPRSRAHDGGTLVRTREVLHARSSAGGDCTASPKASTSRKGNLKSGELLIAGLSAYRGRPERQAFRGHPTDRRKGENLLLFLKKSPARGHYEPVASGVRVLWAERYYAFEQFNNPGPYVLVAHRGSAVKYLEYRARLKVGLKRNRILSGLLRNPADVKDARLLSYLKKRLRRPRPRGPLAYNHRDRIAEGICRSLALRDEPALIARALRLRPDYHCSDVLIRGLITPRGRDFALARAAAPAGSPSVRRRWSRILEFLGDDYYSKYVFTRNGGSFTRATGEESENGHFVTRMASIALERARRPDITRTLVKVLSSYSRGRMKIRPGVRRDTLRALTFLRKLHDRGTAGVQRFYVQETICRISRKACREVTGLARPALSLVRRVRGGVNFHGNPGANFVLDRRLRANEVVLDYRIAFLAKPHSSTRMELILASADGLRTHSLPMHPLLPAGDTITGTTRVRLPAGLRAGEYRLYLRITIHRRAAGPAHPASFVRGRDLSFGSIAR